MRALAWGYSYPPLSNKRHRVLFLLRECEKNPRRIQLGFKPKTFWILVRCSYHWVTWIISRGMEDKLHKQHCREPQPNSNWFHSLSELDWIFPSSKEVQRREPGNEAQECLSCIKCTGHCVRNMTSTSLRPHLGVCSHSLKLIIMPHINQATFHRRLKPW